MRLFFGVWITTLGMLLLAIGAIVIASGGADAKVWAIVFAATVATDFGMGLASEGWEREG